MSVFCAPATGIYIACLANFTQLLPDTHTHTHNSFERDARLPCTLACKRMHPVHFPTGKRRHACKCWHLGHLALRRKPEHMKFVPKHGHVLPGHGNLVQNSQAGLKSAVTTKSWSLHWRSVRRTGGEICYYPGFATGCY